MKHHSVWWDDFIAERHGGKAPENLTDEEVETDLAWLRQRSEAYAAFAEQILDKAWRIVVAAFKKAEPVYIRLVAQINERDHELSALPRTRREARPRARARRIAARRASGLRAGQDPGDESPGDQGELADVLIALRARLGRKGQGSSKRGEVSR